MHKAIFAAFNAGWFDGAAFKPATPSAVAPTAAAVAAYMAGWAKGWAEMTKYDAFVAKLVKGAIA